MGQDKDVVVLLLSRVGLFLFGVKSFFALCFPVF